MITDKEILISSDSYIKKDFYQIYPEILEMVQKISERWNPQTSNESDPGVVLLKLLAFIADKNNYNIDKNVLECFMPSATQEDSMRKLCEMMGYEMAYYKSATTTVRVSYQGTYLGTTSEQSGEEIFLKAFKTYFTNEDEDVNYVLLDDIILTRKYEAKEVRVIEGTLKTCYSNNAQDSDLIKLANLDDNHRFYLPERMIAQNGIWVASSDASDNIFWEQVDNLNTQISGKKFWKFGYDSREGLPYVQFPDDISEIIGDGLRITYVRTSGVNGNVSAASLVKLTTTTDYNGVELTDEEGVNSLIVRNESAATNGVDKETIDQAYNNFKKTIGTFDTLVSCRDYANKIYQLVSSSDNTTHLVSNCQVSDIRDDLNRSASVMTFNSYGVSFDDISYKNADDTTDKIDHFDLYLYPFAEITGSYTIDSYKNSFLPTFATLDDIENKLQDYKTISHDIKVPEEGDICCIKNFYKLTAKITTTYKVNTVEEKAILKNVYTALYKTFNMRNVDFGEEIPYDSILKTIESADVRIKNVALDEPELETKYTVLTNGTGVEYDLYSNRDTYIRFLSKNILAGRTPLFDYDNRFEFRYGDIPYDGSYELTYGGGDTPQNQITKIDTETIITPPTDSYKLKQNEVIQFIAPNFATYVTYPAYVNYHFVWATPSSGTAARPAVVLKPAPFGSPTTSSNLNTSSSSYTGPWYRRVLNPSPAAGDIHDDNYVYTLEDDKTFNSNYEYVKLSSISPVVVIGTAPAGQPTADNFNATGPWYRREASGAGAGYLNDGSFRYIKVLNYSASYTYFKLEDVGADAIPPCIAAGKEYKLRAGDFLYINYTDSNSNVFNIKYSYNEIVTNGRVEAKPDGVIIKPNFNLQNSSSYSPARNWSKTSGFNEAWGIAGMFALASDEQIELRDFVKSKIQTPTYCYWLIGDGHIPFTTDPQDNNTFSYILKEGEYFFYTDEAKASLVTLGSGTKLIRGGSDYATTSINMYINYAETTQIDIDDVSNNGIGAFADDPWSVLRFTENDWLTVQEMQFITLTEGDELLSVTNLQAASITNDFAELDGAEYAIYGQPTETLSSIDVGNVNWQVRSRLDLNVGPNLKQKLSQNQTITLYRTVNESDEVIATITPDSGTDIYLKSNYLIQKNGGDGISALITYMDSNQVETEAYPITFILLSSGNALYDLYAKNSSGEYVLSEEDKVLTTRTYDNNYTKVNLQAQRNIRLPLAIPSIDGENEEFGLIMFYYVPAAASSPETYATLSTDVSNTIRRYNEYNTETGDVSDYSNSLQLKEGINIIQVKSSCTLTITSTTGNGTITFSKLSCVNDRYNTNHDTAITLNVPEYSTNGVDVKGLALDYRSEVPVTDREFYKLLQDIRKVSYIDDIDVFYYSCDIDNSLLIDTKLTDPRVFYDYNNVYNKFVISELDADYFTAGGISLTKASKIK